MRRNTLFLSVLFFLIFAFTAEGQHRVLPSGEVLSLNGNTAARAAGLPTACPSGGHRADDSDPEMQSLWKRIITPNQVCNQSPLILCDSRRKMLEEGGERLAAYMIGQYNSSVNKGCPDSTYLELLGATGNRGTQYLLEKAGRPGEPRAWLQGLLFANDLQAIDRAVEVLRQDEMAEFHVLAVSVMLVNMRSTGVVRPSDLGVLQRLERDSNVRGQASRTLYNLEMDGLVEEDQPHPPDLKQWQVQLPK